MKEDILEQLVDDYLKVKGYFTRHNLRFKPSDRHPDFVQKDDAVASDIDVIGIHPDLTGPDRVLAVSCKSWQAGFDPAEILAEGAFNRIVAGRPAWKHFRELCRPKWSEAFVAAVKAETGTATFTYCTAVTSLRSRADRRAWEQNENFIAALGGNPIRLITLAEMLTDVWSGLTKTPANSAIGRTLQLMKAAGWSPPP